MKTIRCHLMLVLPSLVGLPFRAFALQGLRPSPHHPAKNLLAAIAREVSTGALAVTACIFLPLNLQTTLFPAFTRTIQLAAWHNDFCNMPYATAESYRRRRRGHPKNGPSVTIGFELGAVGNTRSTQWNCLAMHSWALLNFFALKHCLSKVNILGSLQEINFMAF